MSPSAMPPCLLLHLLTQPTSPTFLPLFAPINPSVLTLPTTGVPIPALTEERRKEIVKTASTKVEDAKVAIRNIREDVRKTLKNSKDLSEDVKKRAEKEIDDLTKEFTDKIDAEFKAKEQEIMKI